MQHLEPCRVHIEQILEELDLVVVLLLELLRARLRLARGLYERATALGCPPLAQLKSGGGGDGGDANQKHGVGQVG